MRRQKKRIFLFFLCMTALAVMLPLTAHAQGPEPPGAAGRMLLPAFVGALIATAVTWLLMSQRGKKLQRQYSEQLAKQEQLLSRERQQRQEDGVITVLSSEYKSVFGVDLDKDALRCYRADEKAAAGIKAGDCQSYRKWIAEYAGKYVAEADRSEFLRFTDPESIRTGVENETSLSHRYRRLGDGAERYEQLRFVGSKAAEAGESEIGMAFSDVDREAQNALEQWNNLSRALAEAEKASKTDLSFLSRMSHEIRTPMNAIIGLDTLALNDDTLSEKSRDYLVKIGDSAQHLLGLINEILDMSRIESGQMTLRREEFPFKAMLEQISNAAASQCKDKGLSFECRFLSPVDDYYSGDETKLKEVLSHLLSSAVKHTDAPGSVTMTVARTTVFDDRSTLLFRVKDTGAGIEKERLQHIFDAFSQDEAGRNTKPGSTGLGLAITKNLVEMMDGSITVESEKGKGTEFTVTLTLNNCAQRAAESAEPIDFRDMYVLVVDDNLNSAKYTKSVLDKVGIRADMCTSGPDALRMIELQHGKHQPYQLVLMDCNMPEMDGLEATERIKAKYGDEITVVILTAYNWDYIAEEAQRVGVDSFLVKPLFPANVIEEFDRIARRNHITRVREKGKAELAGRRILLAEDMAINAEILRDILSMEDVQTDHAENGVDAVKMFQNSAPGFYSAILMDVRMPEMDGLEATKAIRALEREDAKVIPIIAMTANAFDEDIKYSLQAGMNAHLCKPVEPGQLFQVMGELIMEAQNGSAQ